MFDDHQLELLLTEDGSPTLYSPIFEESYHSMRGAFSESQHICVDNGLRNLLCEAQIRVLEDGFGLGMNFCVAARWALQNVRTIDYTTLELYPVPEEIFGAVSFKELTEVDDIWRNAHESAWGVKVQIASHIYLTKINIDFTRYTPSATTYNIVFFDAFSPAHVPEQWNSTMFSKIYEALVPGGCLVTYCARGSVKQALREVGFQVYRRQGALGKHHMLVAKK